MNMLDQFIMFQNVLIKLITMIIKNYQNLVNNNLISSKLFNNAIIHIFLTKLMKTAGNCVEVKIC